MYIRVYIYIIGIYLIMDNIGYIRNINVYVMDVVSRTTSVNIFKHASMAFPLDMIYLHGGFSILGTSGGYTP